MAIEPTEQIGQDAAYRRPGSAAVRGFQTPPATPPAYMVLWRVRFDQQGHPAAVLPGPRKLQDETLTLSATALPPPLPLPRAGSATPNDELNRGMPELLRKTYRPYTVPSATSCPVCILLLGVELGEFQRIVGAHRDRGPRHGSSTSRSPCRSPRCSRFLPPRRILPASPRGRTAAGRSGGGQARRTAARKVVVHVVAGNLVRFCLNRTGTNRSKKKATLNKKTNFNHGRQAVGD